MSALEKTCALKLAITGVILVALLSGAGIFVLIAMEKDVPEGVVAVLGACVGGLGTLLNASTREPRA